MRLTGSRAYYRPTPPKMPPGLAELMEGLTKEVLQHNPTDVYEFCAGHMQHLLEIRDGPPRKKTLTLEERISKVQKKIRQRSEIRRQEYDKNVLLQQAQSETDEKMNNNSNTEEVTQLLSEELVSPIDIKIPVHHVQELANSSEIEILHEPGANEIKKDNPQYENVTETEAVISDEMKSNEMKSIVDETKNVGNIPMNENNDNELISLPNESNVYMNDASGDILKESNVHNNGSGNYKEQNICENKTEMQLKIINNSFEKEKTVNNHQEKIQNVEVQGNNYLNNDETKIHDTNIDKQSLQVQENYIDISKNISDLVSNESKLDEESKNATDTEIRKKSEGSSENLLNDAAMSEIDANNPSINDIIKRDSNSINEVAIPVIEINDVYDAELSKTEDLERSNETDAKNSLKSDENVEESKLSVNSNKEAATEEKVEIKYINIPQSEKTEDDKNYNNDPTLITKDAIEEMHPNDVQDKALVVDAVIPPIEAPAVNEEKNSLNISISGDEEITAHSGLKQDNLNELYMKSSSVTNTDPKDGSSDIENLSIKLVDNTPSGTNNCVNEDEKNIGPPANNENDNSDSNVDLETAAITIQKVFRSFLFKSRASTFDDNGSHDEVFLDEGDTNKKEENEFPIPSTITLERRPHGITRMDTVLQTVNEEKSLSLSTDDSSTLSSAATIIQAHVRGFLVRNKLNSNKTLSTNSFPASNSNDPSLTSLDNDIDQHKNKTVLNIHIVPEGPNFLSRDESIITSMELSLDGSPPSSISLYPLGYNKSERRKQLKREDAIQSISPPSNNSGKLSEDVDSVKEVFNDNSTAVKQQVGGSNVAHSDIETAVGTEKVTPAENSTKDTVIRSTDKASNDTNHTDIETNIKERRKSLINMTSDEMDVVTPLISNEDKNSSDSKLMHSGEFHDLVLPTRVSRSDTTVVRGE